MDFKTAYAPLEVVCKKGDPSSDLYFLDEGHLLVCTIDGTEVKVVARIGPGQFVGELSFFDGKPRSTYLIALEQSIVLQIPKDEIMSRLPTWYIEIGKNLTKKIRLLDDIVHQSHFRKTGTEDQKSLTIDDQRKILASISH